MQQTRLSTAHPARRRGLLWDIRQNYGAYLMIVPALAYVIIFSYCAYPYMLIAFQKFNYKRGLFGSEWIGLKNFEFFFRSPSALSVTMNTVRLNVMAIVLGVIVSVFFALLLNEVRSKVFARVNQSLMLLPYFLSWVIISYIVYSLFSTQEGLINRVMMGMGMERNQWYAMPGAWVWILVFIRIWKTAGYSIVIYLSAITGIDETMYEAATIDGASRWQCNAYITIPMLIPTVSILMLLDLGKAFFGDFNMIYAIIRDNGVLYPTADIIDTYVFRALRRTGDPSQAMAVGLYQSFMGFLLVFGSNALVRRFSDDGQGALF